MCRRELLQLPWFLNWRLVLKLLMVGLLPCMQLRFVLRLHLLVHQLHLECLLFQLFLQLIHSLQILCRHGFSRSGAPL